MTVDLALFDIDGTLTVSNKIDTDCFVHAFRDAFGIADMAVGWQHYEHSTDRGITAEVLRRAWAREASEEELTKHRQRFLQRLREQAHEIRPVRGAREFLARVIGPVQVESNPRNAPARPSSYQYRTVTPGQMVSRRWPTIRS